MPRFVVDAGAALQLVAEKVETFDALLTDILTANLAQISIQQNDDTRRISALVGLIAAPTVIGSIYGMNFDHMPELHWTLGYPFAVALMVVLGLTLYSIFKRRGWL